MEFNQHLRLFKSTYRDNPWWLFAGRNFRVIARNNCDSLDIAAVEFYYDQKVYETIKKLLTRREITQLVDNGSIEIIGLSLEAHLPQYYLFELHKFVNKTGAIGFMLLCLDTLEHCDYAVFLNCLLFNEVKRPATVIFSEREREILYFIMSGKTYGEIAAILSGIHGKVISASCIGKIVRSSLYSKFEVWNKFELRQALLRSDWVRQVPASIINYRVNNARKRSHKNVA